MLSRYLRKIGLGALIYAFSMLLGGISVDLLSSFYYKLLRGELTTREVQLSILAIQATLVLFLVFMIYGVRLMKKNSSYVSRVIIELEGLNTGFSLLFRGIVLALIGALVFIIGYLLEMLEPLLAGLIIIAFGSIATFVGLILIGLRMKSLRYVFIDPGYGPTLILIGAILLFFGIGSVFVRLGFLLLGLKLYRVPESHPDIVNKIAEEMLKELNEEGTVNILEFASKHSYPIRLVYDAAFAIASARGYKIVNGMLVKNLML